MSRPPKLTPDLQRAIVDAVRAGISLQQASERAGVGFTTVKDWITRGEGRHPERRSTPAFVAFAAAIKKARAEDEARRVARIEQAARGGAVVYEKTTTYPDGRVVHEVKTLPPQWVADAWHLERSNPKTWGRRDRVDHHHYAELIKKRARELAERFDLDVEEMIQDAEEWANNARLEDLDG